MSTEPISKARLDALIKLYERADDTSPFNYEHDTAAALRDYARLREENVEADARRYRWLMNIGDATWNPIANRDHHSDPLTVRRRVEAHIDAALQGPRHE